MDKREMRGRIAVRAAMLTADPTYRILAGKYARKGLRETQLCLLGGLTVAAMHPDTLGEVTLEETTVSETGETCLFEPALVTDFIYAVLSMVWDKEDIALMECAFEGDVSNVFGRRIRLPSIDGSLWEFFHWGCHENVLKTEGERNLVGAFQYARTLKGAVPDDPLRYIRILKSIVRHGGLYNPRG